MSAYTGRASSIGGLSVPPSWATPLAVRQIAAVLPGTAPIIKQNSQTTADSPYTGMALASVVGTSMAVCHPGDHFAIPYTDDARREGRAAAAKVRPAGAAATPVRLAAQSA